MLTPQAQGHIPPTIRWLLAVFFPLLLGCASTAVATMTSPIKTLASDGRLLGTVTITEQQLGFAGITGVTWSIDADGKYHAARFVNEKTEPPHKQGQLTPTQLRAVGKAIENDLAPLPAQLGRQAEINPHTIVIRFARHTWSLELPPGQSIDEAWHEYSAYETDPRYQFLLVVRAFLDSIGE